VHITLIDPLLDYRAHCQSEALGLLYLGAVLREAGHTVWVESTGLKDGLTLDPAAVREADWVGVTSTSALFGQAKRVLAQVRALRPEVPVVLGGSHATVATSDALAAGFDFAFLGESERTVVDFCDNLRLGQPHQTRGIAFLDPSGQLVRTEAQPLIEDLDTVPFPARDLFDYDAFRARGGWEFGVLSSRGCPFRCTFCQPTLNQIFGHMRKRGAENVAAELAELVDRYHPPMIYFKDDTLTANGLAWFRDFQAALRSHGVSPPWKCNTRVDKVGPRVLDLMAETGCHEVVFGVESGSQRVLDFYKKGIRVEQTERAFELCRERGIRTGANVILGAPIETAEELEMTAELLERIQPDHCWVFFCTALPGKELTRYVVEHNLGRRNLGYHYYDTAMNGVWGETNIVPESLRMDQLVEVRNRILARNHSEQLDKALELGIDPSMAQARP